MDEQTGHDIIDVRSQGGGASDLFGLAISLAAILGLTSVFAGLTAALLLIALVAVLGVDDTRSFFLSLQFDIPTKAKLGAVAVSLLYGALASAILVLARAKERRTWRHAVAWTPTASGWRRNASIAVMVLIYAVMASLALAHLRERHVPLDGPTDTLLVGLIVTNYVLFAPVAEELLFRGWIYTGLRRRFRFGTSLFATSLLFAAFHWEPRRMVLVLPLAFALGFIREQTGSIKPTVVLHACYNVVIVGIALLTA